MMELSALLSTEDSNIFISIFFDFFVCEDISIADSDVTWLFLILQKTLKIKIHLGVVLIYLIKSVVILVKGIVKIFKGPLFASLLLRTVCNFPLF